MRERARARADGVDADAAGGRQRRRGEPLSGDLPHCAGPGLWAGQGGEWGVKERRIERDAVDTPASEKREGGKRERERERERERDLLTESEIERETD